MTLRKSLNLLTLLEFHYKIYTYIIGNYKHLPCDADTLIMLLIRLSNSIDAS